VGGWIWFLEEHKPALRMKRYAYIRDVPKHSNGVLEEEERGTCLNIQNPAI